MGEAIMFIFQLGLKCQILFLNSFYNQVSQLGGVFHSGDQMDCNIRHHVHQQFRFCFLDQIKKEYFNPAYRYSRDAKTEDEVHHF